MIKLVGGACSGLYNGWQWLVTCGESTHFKALLLTDWLVCSGWVAAFVHILKVMKSNRASSDSTSAYFEALLYISWCITGFCYLICSWLRPVGSRVRHLCSWIYPFCSSFCCAWTSTCPLDNWIRSLCNRIRPICFRIHWNSSWL